VTEVRAVTRADGALLRSVRLAALEECPAAFLETHAEVMEDPLELWEARAAAGMGDGDALVLLAFAADRAVGMAGIARDVGQRRRHRATLWGVWVHPEHRGRGVGRQLVCSCLDWAREHGVRAVYLEVVEGEDPTRSLYGRLGFVRREIDPYGVHIDGRDLPLERLVLVL